MNRLAVIAASLAVAGCTSIQLPPPIAGTEWRVTAINGHATPRAPEPYRMRFEARTLGGQFGCNHFGGDYRVESGILTTDSVMMTEMGCSEPASSFEHWGMLVLQKPARLVWKNEGHVTLSNEAGSIQLRR